MNIKFSLLIGTVGSPESQDLRVVEVSYGEIMSETQLGLRPVSEY